jgi:hypothetical protein
MRLDYDAFVTEEWNYMADSYADLYNQFYPFWNTPKIFNCLINVSSQYDIKHYGAVNTPLLLVRKMVEKIPVTAFDGKVLDPACGHGTFLYEAQQKMIKNGMTFDETLENLFGVDIDLRKCYITSAILNPESKKTSNIFWGNALTGTNPENPTKQAWTEMKFRVVLGNPPYNDSAKTQEKNNKQKSYKQKPWPLFTQKFLETLDKNGILCLLTPASWLAGTYDIRQGRISLIEEFSKKNLKYVDVTTKLKAHFNVGSSFSFFVIENSEYTGSTTFKTDYGYVNNDIRHLKSLPPDPHPLKLSINRKTILSNVDKFDFSSVSFSRQGEDAKTMSDEYSYKGYCAGGQYGNVIYSWWKTPDRYFKKRKVLIGKQDRSYLPFVDDEGLCIGQNQLWWMALETYETLEAAISVFNSMLYRFLILANKHGVGPETWLVYALPALDLTRSWTDSEIYEYFGLTEEEIGYINSVID